MHTSGMHSAGSLHRSLGDSAGGSGRSGNARVDGGDDGGFWHCPCGARPRRSGGRAHGVQGRLQAVGGSGAEGAARGALANLARLDAEQREVALTQAVDRRRISASTAAALLPPPDRIDEGDGAHQVRANLQRIREQLAALPSPLQRARAARAARLREQRQTVRARKSGMLEQIWRYAYLYPDTFPVFPLLTYDQSVSARVRPECRCPMPVPAAQAKRKAA